MQAQNTPIWIDAHCHLADPRFGGKRGLSPVLGRARDVGVGIWVQGGVDPADWERQLELKKELGGALVTCFGLHPWWVAKASAIEIEKGLVELEKSLPLAQGFGELGLDFHPRHAGKESFPQQLQAFESQLDLAKKHPLPLVLHIVEAHAEALSLLKKHHPHSPGGIVHSFGASAEIAQSYLDLGFTLSIGAGVVRPGYKALKRAVVTLPLDRIVIETDSPDQSPGPKSDDLNEPRNLLQIAEAVGKLRGASKEEILNQSAQNLRKLFRIDK